MSPLACFTTAATPAQPIHALLSKCVRGQSTQRQKALSLSLNPSGRDKTLEIAITALVLPLYGEFAKVCLAFREETGTAARISCAHVGWIL